MSINEFTSIAGRLENDGQIIKEFTVGNETLRLRWDKFKAFPYFEFFGLSHAPVIEGDFRIKRPIDKTITSTNGRIKYQSPLTTQSKYYLNYDGKLEVEKAIGVEGMSMTCDNCQLAMLINDTAFHWFFDFNIIYTIDQNGPYYFVLLAGKTDKPQSNPYRVDRLL
jgi:hypothetical protein